MLRDRDADSQFDVADHDRGSARWSPGPVALARRCGEFGCVGVGFVDARAYSPAGCFLRVVAALAQAETVVRGGGSSLGPWLRVVAVPDRRVTVGSAATLISQLDEGAQ